MDLSATRCVWLAAMLIYGCREGLMPDKTTHHRSGNPPSPQPSPGAPDSPLSLTGETVDIIYVGDPTIGHGAFELRNAGDAAVFVAVTAAWLDLGDQRKPLDRFSIFDLAQERMVDPGHFQVGARASLGFWLGFPIMAYEPEFGESSAVGVTLSASGTEMTARSPLHFVRRIPRTR